MHMEMVLILLFALVICQLIILVWKKYHLRSYEVKTLEDFDLLAVPSLGLHHARHVAHSNLSCDQTFLHSFHSHLAFHDARYALRHPSSDAPADRTAHAAVGEECDIDRREARWADRFSRLVYKWFLLVYKVSYGLAIAGYFFILFTLLGITNIFSISSEVFRLTLRLPTRR